MGKKPFLSSYNQKIVALLWAISLIPLFLYAVLAYGFLQRTYQKNTISHMETSLRQIALNIENKLEHIYNLSNVLANDVRLQRIDREKPDSMQRYILINEYLIPRMLSALHATNDSIQVSLYLDNKDVPEYYSSTSDEYMYPLPNQNPLLWQDRFGIYHFYRARSHGWVDENGLIIGDQWQLVARDELFGNISFFKTIYSLGTVKGIGLVRVNVRQQDIFQSIYEENPTYGSIYQIIDSNGVEVITSRDYFPINDTKNYYYVERLINGGDFTIVAAVSKKEMMHDLMFINIFFVVAIVIFTILLMCTGFIFSKKISVHVYNIQSALRAFRDGDMGVRVKNVHTHDEFAQIADSANDMMDSIQELIYRDYQMELNRLRLEQGMLQAQINPHFLYNILSTIGNLAVVGESEKIYEMVLLVATFYRVTLSTTRIIPLSKELHQVEQYIKIISIKYHERLGFSISVPDELYKVSTLSFTIQPFIENAVKHGWINERLNINLKGTLEEGHVVLVIEDDGAGFDMAGFDYQNSDKSREHHGIYNVHRRLKLHYGNEYGVFIESEKGKGTRVTLRFPYQGYEEQGECE